MRREMMHLRGGASCDHSIEKVAAGAILDLYYPQVWIEPQFPIEAILYLRF